MFRWIIRLVALNYATKLIHRWFGGSNSHHTPRAGGGPRRRY
jgi:hypothetical protein